jgi:uncharacterized protein
MPSHWEQIGINLLTGSYQLHLPVESNLGRLGAEFSTMPEFIWDEHNLYHILVEHKERDLSVAEIESVFADPDCLVREAGNDDTGEKQYFCVGLGNKNIVRFVLYNVRNGKIRPFSVRTAKRNKERQWYYDELEKKGK